MKLLSSGGYGKVYDIGKYYVVKEINNFDKKRLTDNRLNLFENEDQNIWREIYIHKKLNKLKQKELVNVPTFYGNFIKNEKFYLYIEKFDGSLDNIVHDLTITQIKSILFQILYTFDKLQNLYNFFQGDVNTSNMLYKQVNDNKHLKYKVNNTTFNVPLHGVFAVVSDFGNAQISDFELTKDEKSYESKRPPKIELYHVLYEFSKIMNKKIKQLYKNSFFSKLFQKETITESELSFLKKLNEFIDDNLYFKIYNIVENGSKIVTVADKIDKPINAEQMFNILFDDYVVNQ